MSFKTEFLAFAFGCLLVLVTFGDNHLGKIAGVTIGNLDTILGFAFWPVLDLLYPLFTIVIFLLSGWIRKRKFIINASSVLLFATFLVLLSLMNFDDIAIGLRIAVYPPLDFWVAITLVYPIFSSICFFLFGKFHEKG